MDEVKLVLIGGTSHVGKSTLGRCLADDLGWDYLSTDQLARHPGRPWRVDDRPLPADVVEHYRILSVSQLVESVLLHYRLNVWPIISAIIRSRIRNDFDRGLVFEGSAIMPEPIGTSEYVRVEATWLSAPQQVICDRVFANSAYDRRSAAEQQLIDAFLQRALVFDRIVRDGAERFHQDCLDASLPESYATLRSLA